MAYQMVGFLCPFPFSQGKSWYPVLGKWMRPNVHAGRCLAWSCWVMYCMDTLGAQGNPAGTPGRFLPGQLANQKALELKAMMIALIVIM